MNKNEILDKSRKENKKLDEMERDALYRAVYMASVVGRASVYLPSLA